MKELKRQSEWRSAQGRHLLGSSQQKHKGRSRESNCWVLSDAVRG